MLRRLLTFTLILLSCCCYAQQNSNAKFGAMANSSAALYDLWSVSANPAGIVSQQSINLGLNFTKFYFSDELSEQNLAFVMPLKNKNFIGLSFNRYGISEYQELSTGAVLAKKFGDKLSIGLKANYHQLKINNYGSSATFTVDVGANYVLNNELTLGIYLNNPSSQHFKTTNVQAKIPSAIHLGIAYQPSNKIILASTASKDFDEKLDVAIGVAYQLIDSFSIRGGINAKPFKQNIGIGINLKNILIDIAVSNHPQIGFTPQIGLSYAF